MAIIHRAYRLDSTALQSRVEKLIYNKQYLDIEKLRSTALSIVQEPTELFKEILEDLRYDDTWFDLSDPEISLINEWYMLILASECTPTLSLSNQSSPVSWRVLELSLPFVAWEQVAIELLIRGRPLDEFVRSSNNKVVVNEFQGVNQFGGWLSLQDAKNLFDNLTKIQETLPTEASNKKPIVDFAELWGKHPMEFIEKAISDAVKMLKAAIIHKADIFVILD